MLVYYAMATDMTCLFLYSSTDTLITYLLEGERILHGPEEPKPIGVLFTQKRKKKIAPRDLFTYTYVD